MIEFFENDAQVEQVKYSVFTKPWKTLSVWQLGRYISGLGFDGIELPLRKGYQLESQNARKLPEIAKQLGEHGLKIYSVASETEEHVFAGCAEAGIPIIRVMGGFDKEMGSSASFDKTRAGHKKYLKKSQ